MNFVVVYRWRVDPDREADFRRAWSITTALLARDWNSGGSALLHAHDGTLVGIARWPDRETRERAFTNGPVDADAAAVMRQSVLESFAPLELDMVDDQWRGAGPAAE